jgi:arylformamidase
MKKLYDITLEITEDMITYPGNPPVRLEPHDRIANGDDANVTHIAVGSHTGTHLDAPHHFIDGARTVDELPLERLIGPCVVADIPHHVTAIGAGELQQAGIEGETRVLLRTRNGELLEKHEFDASFAHITGDGAAWLADAGVELVGIDYLSIEAFDADEPVAHRTLLEREIIAVEGLDLRRVPPGRYELLCLPLRIAIDGAPVRAVLREL